jgi:hypothetical protein
LTFCLFWSNILEAALNIEYKEMSNEKENNLVDSVVFSRSFVRFWTGRPDEQPVLPYPGRIGRGDIEQHSIP